MPIASRIIVVALVVTGAFNLANAALGWLSLQQLGPDAGNIAQLCLGVSATVACLWAAVALALRQPAHSPHSTNSINSTNSTEQSQ